MKRFFCIALLIFLASKFCQAQTGNYSLSVYQQLGAKKTHVKTLGMLSVDSVFMLPLDTLGVIDGTFAYKNGLLYYRFGYWKPVLAGGSTNTPVGNGFDVAISGTDNVKRLRDSAYIHYDSSIANTIRAYLDTANLFAIFNSKYPQGVPKQVGFFDPTSHKLTSATGNAALFDRFQYDPSDNDGVLRIENGSLLETIIYGKVFDYGLGRINLVNAFDSTIFAHGYNSSAIGITLSNSNTVLTNLAQIILGAKRNLTCDNCLMIRAQGPTKGLKFVSDTSFISFNTLISAESGRFTPSGHFLINTTTDIGGKYAVINGSTQMQDSVLTPNLVRLTDTTGFDVDVIDRSSGNHKKIYAGLIVGSGGGEANTASNLGGGVANYSTKVGVDLRFNSFNSNHFTLSSNLISLDSVHAYGITSRWRAQHILDSAFNTSMFTVSPSAVILANGTAGFQDIGSATSVINLTKGLSSVVALSAANIGTGSSELRWPDITGYSGSLATFITKINGQVASNAGIVNLDSATATGYTSLWRFWKVRDSLAATFGTPVSIVGSFSGSSISNGASISGNTITFGPADGTNPGMVTIGSQSFSGAKTFNGAIRNNANVEFNNPTGGIDNWLQFYTTGFGTWADVTATPGRRSHLFVNRDSLSLMAGQGKFYLRNLTHNNTGTANKYLTLDTVLKEVHYIDIPAGITALTGDGTASGPGSAAFILATVNSNVGSFGSATQSVQLTINAKGLVTAASNVTVTPAIGSITGLGTNVATWLATPSSANLRAGLSDENGTGAALFNGATTPDWTTGFTVGGAAGSGKIMKGNGTNFVPSTETYAAPGTSGNVMKSDGTNWTSTGRDGEWILACSDETTAITTGTGKLTFRTPFAVTVTGVRASVNTVSSSGIPTFNIKEAGSTIFSTKLTIDASEKTSTTAATAAVISDNALADDAEITIDFDVAGTGAKGVKIIIYWTKS